MGVGGFLPVWIHAGKLRLIVSNNVHRATSWLFASVSLSPDMIGIFSSCHTEAERMAVIEGADSTQLAEFGKVVFRNRGASWYPQRSPDIRGDGFFELAKMIAILGGLSG